MDLLGVAFAIACGGGILYLLRRLLRVGIDTEVRVVITAAETVGAKTGKRVVDDALFVRASLCNSGVAAALGRAGWSAIDAAHELDAILASGTPVASEKPPLCPALLRAVKEAARATVRRWDAAVTLVDVLTAIRDHGDTATAQLMRARALRFEDPDLVAVLPGVVDESSAEHFVYLLNDPVSPMESVTALLRNTVGYDVFRATYVMLTVHRRGYAALGPYERNALDGVLQRFELAARSLGMDKLALAGEAPNTTGWKKTDRGLLPPV